MAKNKKTQHKQNFKPISPERFLQDRVSSLPAGPCWIGINPKREGLWEAVVTRVRPSGNLVYVRFRIDTFCRGVCSWKWIINITPEDVDKKMSDGTIKFEKVSLEEAVSLINGAVEFAEEGGIRPAVGFKIISNVLKVTGVEKDSKKSVSVQKGGGSSDPSDSSESSESSEPSESSESTFEIKVESPSQQIRQWTYGRDGRHCLIIGEQGTERKFIPLLRDALGDDGFDMIELFVQKSEEDNNEVGTAVSNFTDSELTADSPTVDNEASINDCKSKSEEEELEDDSRQRGAPTPLKPLKQPKASKNTKSSTKKNDPEPPKLIVPTLKPDIDNDEAYSWAEDSGEGFPLEEYHYKAPAYPRKLVLKNKWIYDEFVAEENRYTISGELTDKILNIDPAELEDDLCRIIMYEIGHTRRKLELPSLNNSAIIHSVIFLSHLARKTSRPTVLELLRQGDNFLSQRVGPDYTDRLGSLLCRCGLEDSKEFESFLKERGRQAGPRSVVADALITSVRFFPDKRTEVINFFKTYIHGVIKGLRKCEGADPVFAAYLVYSLLQLRPIELLDEIKSLVNSGKVATSICGTLEQIESSVNLRRPTFMDNFTTIQGAYPLQC